MTHILCCTTADSS